MIEKQIRPLYRYATIADAKEIREILGYYIETSTASWRYNVMDMAYFEDWISKHKRPERAFWVAELDGQIVGYSCLSDFRSAEGYWPCAEDSVYVRPEFSGTGIGKQLMKLIIDDAKKAGLQAIIAAIDAENKSSISFHERFGFVECGFIKDIAWKQNSKRSLYLMVLDLSEVVR